MPSTTDRDLCIRLCDFLSGSTEDWFTSTAHHTVVHYADADRVRVSSKDSPAKIEGLKKFYYKYSPRMSDEERMAYKDRAFTLFGCGEEEFVANRQEPEEPQTLSAWAGDELPLNKGTVEMLPKLEAIHPHAEKKRVIFGTITSNIRRIVPLLNDLRAASESVASNFDPFLVIFANSTGTYDELALAIKGKVKERDLKGHVFSRSSPVVDSILQQCNDIGLPSLIAEVLPIAVSRSILQVFIYNLPHLKDADAVCIIDDDKRLPMGWSPFTQSSKEGAPDILIGRDLRTPPNPSIFSLRTNLIDMLYNLDLANTREDGGGDVTSYCIGQTYLETQKFDWYYDLSSSKADHLELPIYKVNRLQTPDVNFAQRLLSNFLVGTPFCRDVIPLDDGPTLQRGGCMVIIKRHDDSFKPLAVQQHAPLIRFDDDSSSHSRRSDSFWCKEMNNRGLNIEVDKQLYVYHDNQFDSISSPTKIRRNVVQELVGGILCRDIKWRKQYKETRIVETRAWLARIKGLLVSLRNRPYCTGELVREFIAPLEEILDDETWENDVFAVVERTFTSLEAYRPNPTDFDTSNTFVKLDADETKNIEKEWNSARINQAQLVLHEAVDTEGSLYVGLGSEGVSFQVDDLLYKVFDLFDSNLPKKVVKLLNASYLDCPNSQHSILKRPFYQGTPYRGGNGLALVLMLGEWRSKKLYHTNLTPDNLILDEKEKILTVVDIGRDVDYEESEYLYQGKFKDMCKRAFLCFRYGCYASNPYALQKLKQLMREDYSSVHLVGFEAFMKHVYGSDKDAATRLEDQLDDLGADNAFTGSAADDDISDDELIQRINEAISKSTGNGRMAIAITDPFLHRTGGISRRQLWWYRHHVHRLQDDLSFSLEEDNVVLTDPCTLQEYVAFHIFILDFTPKHLPSSVLEKKPAWQKQLNQVNFQSIGSERRESIVIAVDVSASSYGSAVHSFDSLARTRNLKLFQSCGVIVFCNGSNNREDIISMLFDKARDILGSDNLSPFALSKKLSTPVLHRVLKSMCSNPNSLAFIATGNGPFDLQSTVCLVPSKTLKVCYDCGSYFDDEVCHCFDGYANSTSEFDNIPCTSLPSYIPSGSNNAQLQRTKLFVSKPINEGKLNIEIVALVSGIDYIKDAENVRVRIHSECLTGDVFYSMKCDCGTEKVKFLQMMEKEEKLSRPSVFIYIKGHEGRGSGLFKKIRAYEHLESNPNDTHVKALNAVGCESDIRQYDTAVRFLKYKLQVKSVIIMTNNPDKIKAVEKYFALQFSHEPMPAEPSLHNKKYLEEKVALLGHEGLLE